MSKELDRDSMDVVINGLIEAADKDRKDNSIVYRDLLAKADDDRQTIFNVYDLAVGDAVISMSDVIGQKYHIERMSDELYEFIRDFPSRFHKLSKQIERDEGMVCCVDKAWTRLMAEFDDLVKQSGGYHD